MTARNEQIGERVGHKWPADGLARRSLRRGLARLVVARKIAEEGRDLDA
jgi:hypothetical protein